MKVTEFFATDFVDFSSYDNLRKIASVVDGQKNASRKVLYTLLEKNIKDKIKVSQLGSKVAEFAEYLHGTLDGVIVNLGQDFPGTNNIPLIQKKGNYGTRFTPDASAARYIYGYGSSEFFDLFKKEDAPVLKHQVFEGNPIEPMFYVPNLPILLINGSEGVSSGFAQKILPRDPEKIRSYIKGTLKTYDFAPFFKNWNGVIEQGDNPSQWLIKGVVKRLNSTTVEITEVPIGYDLRRYLKVLDDLEDRREIVSFTDLSEDDNFKFHVKFLGKTLREMSDDQLMTKLKLIKKVSENYTVIDEENKIQVFENAKQILEYYKKVKLEYVEKRKQHVLKTNQELIKLDKSKYHFIEKIVNDELTISKRKKQDIVTDLEKCDNIIKHEGSYDYLLRMSILNLTSEEMDRLSKRIKKLEDELNKLQKMDAETLWRREI